MRRIAESGTSTDFCDSKTPEGPGFQHARRDLCARLDEETSKRLMERRKMPVKAACRNLQGRCNVRGREPGLSAPLAHRVHYVFS